MPCPKAQLTQAERTRLYVVYKECPTCLAHRGEMCFKTTINGVRGEQYRTGYHWTRGPFSSYGSARISPANKARYQKLRQQILDQREVVGHE